MPEAATGVGDAVEAESPDIILDLNFEDQIEKGQHPFIAPSVMQSPSTLNIQIGIPSTRQQRHLRHRFQTGLPKLGKMKSPSMVKYNEQKQMK